MTNANTTPAQGIMFKFTYRANPKVNPMEVFDVIRFFPGTDGNLIKYNAKNHAMKSGAISVKPITPQQYQELINEETKRSQTKTVTEEAHQA